MSTSTPRETPAYLPHTELGSPAQMHADCRAAERRLDRAAARVAAAPPSLHFDDYPREVRKPAITVDAAAARLAGALHLHLD